MNATKTSDLTTYPGPRRLLRDERGRAVVSIYFQPAIVVGESRTEIEAHWVASVKGWGHTLVATSSVREEVVKECHRRFGDFATPATAVWTV